MKKFNLISVVIAFMFANIATAEDDNWRVVIDNDPESPSRCLMESATHIINDGHTETSVKLVYTGDALYAATKSDIDLSYPGVGLQVDRYEQHGIDGVYMEKTAVFNKAIEKIHRQFISGASAKLTLGFWPTLDKTESRVIEFNLYGYTKTYQQFLQCRKAAKQGQE